MVDQRSREEIVHRAHDDRLPGGVVAGVLGLKVYAVLLLYVFYLQIGVREDYQAFLFLEDGQSRVDRLAAIDASFIERLTPFDGQYYLDIAGRGYRRIGSDDPNAKAGPPGNYAFFPLFPLAARLAGLAGPQAVVGIMLTLNFILSAAAAMGLYRLARRLDVPPWPTVLMLLTFPTAVFQSVLYSESMYLFLVVATALAMESKRRWLAASLGYLGGLCRPQGVLLAALWVKTMARDRDRRTPFWRIANLAPLVAPAIGLATFAGILWYAIDAPLGFIGLQSHWSREFSLSSLLGEAASPGSYEGPPFDLLSAAFGVAMVPFLWRHLPVHLALFGTLSVAMPLATGTVLSFGRFLSISVPHFLCLAKMLEKWRGAQVAVLAGFIVIQCLIAKGLMGWYFVG